MEGKVTSLTWINANFISISTVRKLNFGHRCKHVVKCLKFISFRNKQTNFGQMLVPSLENGFV